MIRHSTADGIWRVTIDRPEKANAVDLPSLRALAEAAHAAHRDPDLRAFVLTGAGDRAFCAGADVAEGVDMFAFTRDPAWPAASGAIAALPCLTIAALNGTVAGGGFCPMLACDVRVAVPGAKFFYPVLKRGFLPQPEDVTRLQTLIGPGQARRILMGGAKLSADEALACGLVDALAPDGLDTAVAPLLADAAAAKPESIAAIKRLFDGPRGAALDDCYSAAYAGDPAAIARVRGAPD
ncbi:MAG: enoyl-CoA hydratase/isomerase family protein [Pseudomonadota bacterium]